MTPIIRHDIFGLTSTPFLRNPKTPFLDPQRQQALERLNQFIQYRGFAAVAGKPGSGKTALIRYFTQSLHQQTHKIVYVPFTHLSDSDVLKAICQRLDSDPPFGKNNIINLIQKRIRDIQPINPVIILDEMQNASTLVMETIRLLANDHFDAQNTLSCILVGTCEFFTKLSLAINQSLTQRITFFCQLRELAKNDTDQYIIHCLKQAGAEQPIFDPAAIQLIADTSKGVIRTINQLAANAMALASQSKSANVALNHVQKAVDLCILPQLGAQP